ncbi:hypothetical protein MesoLjLc_72380 [Mesorhizobium sp. L-8-10]|nr:hypothetical protein MesoLjLc_72380 [Mesorhizobium sp. L-8-10]
MPQRGIRRLQRPVGTARWGARRRAAAVDAKAGRPGWALSGPAGMGIAAPNGGNRPFKRAKA